MNSGSWIQTSIEQFHAVPGGDGREESDVKRGRAGELAVAVLEELLKPAGRDDEQHPTRAVADVDEGVRGAAGGEQGSSGRQAVGLAARCDLYDAIEHMEGLIFAGVDVRADAFAGWRDDLQH